MGPMMKQDWLYPINALLHSFGSIVIVPYLALALFFIFIDQVASSKGLLGILETIFTNFVFYFGKAIYVAPVLWVCLVVMGFVPSLQRWGSICLILLAVFSLVVVGFRLPSEMERDHLVFLLPCLAVVVTNLFLLYFGSVSRQQ